MVARTLVENDIEGGRLLVQELDCGNVPVSAALWFYDREEERYRLFLATRVYDDRGPLEAYRVVQEILKKLPEEKRLSLADINIVSPSDETVVAIGEAVKTPPAPRPSRESGSVGIS